MSKRYPGGLITKTPVVPTISAAPGIWTLDQAITYIKAGTWPIASTSGTYWIGLLGGSSVDSANSVAIDSSGNLYVCGSSFISSLLGLQIAKYNPSGVIQWQRRLTSTGNGLTGKSIAVDSFGNVYVCGYIQIPAAGTGYFILAKYNTSGTFQWQKRLGSTRGNGNGVAIDSSGNPYFCGNGDIGGLDDECLIAKYDASGAVTWQRTLGNATYSQTASGIVLDSYGNVYISGWYYLSVSGSEGIIAKYDTSGTIQWQRRLSGSTYVSIYGITVDSSGNIYACGLIDSSGSDSNFILVKYNAYGTLLWQRILYASGINETANSVTTDSLGNVYVCGYTNPSNINFLIAKYNPSGTIQWQRTISTSGGTNISQSVAIDPFGNMYVVGYTNVSGNSDFLIAKLPSDGSLTGTYTVGGYSVTYAASTLSEATAGVSSSTGSLTDAASSFTAPTSTVTDAATTLTSSVTTL
jgi:uncharacterized delta-60 repeat protein